MTGHVATFATDQYHQFAVQSHSLDLCSYLLPLLNLSPDDEEWEGVCRHVIHHGSANRDVIQGFCKLLIEDHAMSVDLEFKHGYCWDAGFVSLDRVYSDSPGSTLVIDIVKRHQVLPWNHFPLEQRFDVARTLELSAAIGCSPGSPEMFMQLLGVDHVDQELAHFEADSGMTLLHVVAESIAATICFGYEDRTTAWLKFARDCVIMGPPVSLLVLFSGHTPFLAGIQFILDSMDDVQSHVEGYADLYTLEHFVQSWVAFAADLSIESTESGQPAIDLVTYGIEESDSVIESPLSTETMKDEADLTLEVVDIHYGSDPADWDLELRLHRKMPVYQRHAMPGSWPTSRDTPAIILWNPSASEYAEGFRPVSDPIDLWSPSFKLKDAVRGHAETYEMTPLNMPFRERVEKYQDDNDAVMVLCQRYRSRRDQSSTGARRSRSQPVISRWQERSYRARQQSDTHAWLLDYHFCVSDSKYRIGCVSCYEQYDMRPYRDEGIFYVFDLRSCVSGLEEEEEHEMLAVRLERSKRFWHPYHHD